MQRSMSAALLVSFLLCQACSGGDGDGPPSGPVPVATVALSQTQLTVEVGATVQLSAQAKDASGNVLAGRVIAWTSSNTGIATVDQNGLVRGVAAGAVSITATSEGRSASASGEVRDPPVATVEVGPSPAALVEGETLQLTATAKTANGSVLQGKTFTWTSSNAAVLQVTTTGLVAALGAGDATVSAATDGVAGNLAVNVAPGGAIVVTQITPANLVEGQPATITGTGFAAATALNSVTIDGVAAVVSQASATSLQIVVPARDCRPAGNAAVQVRVGARASNAVQQLVSPAQTLSLQVGELAVLAAPADRCLQFAPANTGERYVFGVQSVSDVVSTLTPITVTSAVPAGAATAPPLPAPILASAGAPVPPLAASDRERAQRWASHVASTATQYERERLMYQRLSDAAGRGTADLLAAAAPTVPATVQEGDEIAVRFPQFGSNTCTDFTAINVTVRRISARGIFLEDVANPVALDQATIDRAAADFDLAYDVAVDHFGAPSDVDLNERIAIVITREVNRSPSPPLGFVAHANLFPVTQCQASNEGEFLWIRSADPTGQFTAGVYAVQKLKDDLYRLLMHEFTHVVQGARRRAAGGQFMISWLAEGLATASEEVLGLHVLGLQNGGNFGASVVYPTRGGDPRFFFSYVGDFLAYFGFDFSGNHIPNTPEQCSWVGATSTGNPGPCSNAIRLLYGVSWSVIKNTIDRSPGGTINQKQLLRSFSDHVGPPGLAELEAVLGRPIGTILAEWAPTLYLDDRYPAAGFQLSNFNIRNVAAAWGTPNADLIPRTRGFAGFTDSFSVRAGSSSYYEISGPNRPATAVRVRDSAGDAPPAIIQIWIVRVQ